jgi:nucleotide-binding universal stress UspA family protein
MFQHIMVPLDGSPFGEIAIPAALEIGKRTNGEVRLLHAYEAGARLVPPAESVVLSEEVDRALRDAERKYLTDVVDRIAPSTPVRITSALLDEPAGPSLVEQSVSWPADLVVMTTHGRGPVSRFWLGSVADYVIRHASTPILLLRPKDEVDWAPGDLRIRHVLATTDFSPTADAVLEPVAAMAELFGAEIELANVVEPVLGYTTVFPYPVPTAAEIDETSRAIAHEELDQRARVLQGKGLTVTTKVLFGTGAAGALLDRVRESTPDLVAIATHGRTGWRRAVIGSVADKLVRGAAAAILVVGSPRDGGRGSSRSSGIPTPT